MALSTKIFLIGMPASGKSTLGKELAELLQLEFIDLDSEIEKKEARNISEIFSEAGEDYFRKVERDHLFRVIGEYDSFVMSTGGGTPCNEENIDKMSKDGTVVFLDVPVGELFKRLQSQNLTLRPKLNKPNLESVLSDTIKNRRSYYEKAHHILNGNTITVRQLLAVIND